MFILNKIFRAHYFFTFGCVVATLYTTSQLFLNYNANLDSSTLTMKKPWQGDIFPTISICFRPKKLGLYDAHYINSNLRISASLFKETMLGKPNATNLAYLPVHSFEMATIKIQKYLKKLKIEDTNDNKVTWNYSENVSNINENRAEFKLGNNKPLDVRHIADARSVTLKYQDPTIICYAYKRDLPKTFTVKDITFYFDIQRLKTIEEARLYVFVHHPNQLLRDFRQITKIKGFSGIGVMQGTYILDLNSILLMRNRHDANEPCDEGLKNDDQVWMRHVIDSVGCIPIYWNIFFEDEQSMKYRTVCRTKEQMENLTAYLPYDNEYGRMKIFGMYKMPCDTMHVLASTNSDHYNGVDGELKIRFQIRYFRDNIFLFHFIFK